jgi:assimilatory nitrate reductase catalytic subunit
LNRTGDLPTDHVQFFDAARGARRYIIVEAGRIVAMAYFATSRVCVSRQWAVDQLSSPGDSAISVIAGRAPADVADAGATVCSCFSVGRNEIITAIVEGSCQSLASIGERLGAGTNCGSCRAEISGLLREAAYRKAS